MQSNNLAGLLFPVDLNKCLCVLQINRFQHHQKSVLCLNLPLKSWRICIAFVKGNLATSIKILRAQTLYSGNYTSNMQN